MRALLTLGLFVLVGCGPKELFPPFISVTVENPEGFEAPATDTFEITVSFLLNEQLKTEVLSAPVPPENNTLPLSFNLVFDEPVRGQTVEINIEGLSGGVSMFSASVSAFAGISEVEATARFCGDVQIDNDRSEACDDGPSNSDILPDACRISCEIASCGDLVVDTDEACDDGNTTAGDGCNAECQNEFCGDGVLQAALGEACDDGANNSDIIPGACRTNCRLASCGDGALDQGEECDDGNNIVDDGCESNCVASIVQIAAGFEHTCALTRSGNVRCWGSGSVGQLGYANTNNIGDDEALTSVGNIDLGGIATQIATGDRHTCALLNTGNVRCWGSGFGGQLGYGNTNNIGDDETPASAGNINIGGIAIQIATGGTHTCALISSGNVRCWGAGSFGQLGYGNTNNIGDDELPFSAGNVDVGVTVVQITAGGDHTCALLDTGKVRCWGLGASGRLGYGNTSSIGDDEAPSTAGDVNVGGDVIQIEAGDAQTCAVLSTGNVRCWGVSGSGRLGYGNTGNITDPSSAGDVIVGGTVAQITTGGFHTCALLDTGNTRCWGLGISGQLGYTNTNNIGDNETPASAGDINVGGIAAEVATGNQHTCALLSTGNVLCWGLNDNGQLGYGNTNNIGDDETPASAGDVPLF